MSTQLGASAEWLGYRCCVLASVKMIAGCRLARLESSSKQGFRDLGAGFRHLGFRGIKAYQDSPIAL